MTHAGRWEAIESAQNAVLKEIRRALERGALTEAGLCVAEGPHLVAEAARSGLEIQAVVAAEDAIESAQQAVGRASPARLLSVKAALFRELASTENPQGVLALVRPPVWSEEQVFGARAFVLVLDGVQDPGNAGTLLRSAEAFGASGALLLKGTVRAWNSKALRASAGSAFRVPMLTLIAAEDVPAMFARHAAGLWVMVAQGGAPLAQTDLRPACGVVIGSEGRGVSDALRRAGKALTIGTQRVESLNAAVSGAVVLYEIARQRAGQ